MKTLKLIATFLCVVTFFSLQSCSSDDDSNPQSDTFIRFAIDGTNYEFTDIITAKSGNITLNGNNGEGITNPGDTQLAIWLPSTVETGTFDVSSGSSATHQISFTSNSLGFDFDFANSGSITITSVTSSYIEGTFTATVTEGNTIVNITNGSFKAQAI